jgi:hypothetical protein
MESTLAFGGKTFLTRSSRLLMACAGAVLSLSVQASDKKTVSNNPIVLELYSSQGCSSCPPADKLLGEIARQPNVIAWTLPVDYWDYNGWKDTFGKPAHTNRQKAYAKVRGDGQVYTPQIIVNGVAHVVGSDIGAIRAAGERFFNKKGALSVPVKVNDKNGALEVEVGAAPEGTPKQAFLMIVRVTRQVSVSIGRGENSGRTLEYTNVGRAAARVGEWNGQPQTFTIASGVAANPEADGWIILLQAGDGKAPGPILGAAKSPNI